MATADQSGRNAHAEFYGAGPHRVLNMTLLGGGTGKAPTVPPISSTAGAVQPCAAEILSVANTATGVNTITFVGNHAAIAYMAATVDDINNSTPIDAYLGQAGNLGTNKTMTLVLSTYLGNGGSIGQAVDVALNTPIRIQIWFKDDYTGASA